MKVSVVIATYNGEKYLNEQLETILFQSYTPDEVIISDDVSKDNTIKVAEDFIGKYHLEDKWKITMNDKNKGYAKNFLDAACKANGDIIFFCDQDDLWESNKIEEMVRIMEKDNIYLLASNLKPFTSEKNTRKWDKKKLEEMNKQDGHIERILFNESNFHLKRSGCTMCIKRKFLHKIMPYWIENWAHDDFVWKMALAHNAIGIFQRITLNRRMHENNATVIRVRNREWRVNQILETKKQEIQYLKYLQNNKSIGNEREIKIIEKNLKSLDLRLGLIEKRNLINWIKLYLNYKDCYPRKKGLYLDLYLTYIGEYKGA